MNKSYLSSVKNIILVSKPSTAIRLLLMVLLFVNTAFGQITQPLAWTKAYDQTTLTATGNSFPIGAGTNRILVVGVTTAFDDNNGSGTQADPITISYGGVTLTKATGNGGTTGRMHTWLYFLKDNLVMDATTRPLVVTGGTISSATLANMTVWYAVYAGVDQIPATYTTGNGLNNTGSGAAQLSALMTVNTNEQAVYISNIYNDNGGVTPSYTINANWTSGGFNTGTNVSGGNTVAWKVQVANRTIALSNTTDQTTTSSITPNGNSRWAMSAMSLPKFTPVITSLGSPSGCVGTQITIDGSNFGSISAADVKIGGTPVTSIVSNTNTHIVAIIGNGTSGNVTVTNSGGTATSSMVFSVSPTLIAPTVGTITQPTCSTATGSVVLNGLPIGSWVLTRSPGSVTTTGTGTSTTISGLAAGTTYTYSVNGLSNGLKGEYYNNMSLTGSPVLTRTDATVNFDWVNGTPDPSINSDGFSVRWSGLIQPIYSETYTFSTRSDDGIRLWINGVQVINNWTNHGAVTDTGTITLTGGVKYSIVLEFYENTGQALSQLSWSSTSQTLQIIPTAQLFPVGSCGSPASANVVINAQPAIPSTPGAITGSTTQCAGNTLQTYSVAAVANATSYNWTLPLNWTITAGTGTNSITVSIASNGASDNVSVNAANGCGTSGSSYQWVAVSTPTVAGTVTPTNTNVCSGFNSTNLSLSGNTGSVLRWESSTNNFATAGTPIVNTSNSITVSGLTTDTYYRAVLQSGGCNILNTNSVKLTVFGAMANPGGISISGVSYPVNGSTTNCALTTMTFSIAAVANATSYTWAIPFGWTIVSGQGTTSVSVTTGTTAESNNISVYATNLGCGNTGSTYLYVTLTNTATPTGTAAQSFCSGATVANLAATGTAIQWYAAASGGSPLASTTVLVNGTHYYATQILGSCESSTRFDVTAIINTTPTISGTITPATCSNGSDGAITITGLNVPVEFKKVDNDYIDLGSSLLSNKTAFTVEGWVKFNLADVGSRMSLFGQNDIIEFYLNTNTIELWTPNTGVITTPLTAAIGNNAWHHIAATGNGTSTNIYIDGVLKVSGSGTTNYGTSAYNAQIGSGVVDPLTTTGGGFTGQIEKVGFYSTALPQATITNLAASPTTYLGTETGIIAGYNFSDGTGTTLSSLPAGKNGTFGNSPQWIYTYAWTKTGTPAYTASTKDISSLAPGDYNLTVSTIGVSCPAYKTFTVGSTNTVPSVPTVGTTTQPNCTTLTGSVVLSGLPFPGTLNQTGTATTSYATTGTTMTISGLAVGSYNFTASNGACPSSATGNVVITAAVTNTWNGTWDNGTPTISQALVFSADYSSTGDVNGCSCTINIGKNVKINSGNTLTITNAVTVSGSGTLTFEDTASLVQTNNAAVNSGNITYKRKTSSVITSDYTYWSSPVVNQTLNISPSYVSGMFYSYDDFATPEGWKKETAATIMQIGKGYIIRGPQTTPPPLPPGFYTGTFVGVPNNGIKTIAIGPTGTSNLLGNPYPSAINADTFLATNSSLVEGTIYLWTHNTAIQLASNITNGTAGSGVLAYTSDDYASYNTTGGVGTGNFVNGVEMIANKPTGKIAAGQSFFTTSKANGTSVTFNNAMRVTGNNTQFFKTKNSAKTTNAIEKDRIWLNLSNDQGAFKQTLVGYITDATNDYDSRFDGESFDGNDFVDFYSVNNDKNLVIQGRALPFDENDTVPLGFKSTIDGNFTINIDETDGLLANQAVFIEDKVTNTVTNLKTGNYTFNTVAGTFNDRFVLRYTDKTLGTTDFDAQANTVLVSIKNKQIKVNSFAETINKVTIYDLQGRQIYQKDKVNNNEFLIADLVSSHETLIVKTSLQNGKTVTEKIIY